MQGDKETKAPKETTKRKKAISIPPSAIINFAALFALFTAILFLQHYGQKLRSASNEEKNTAVSSVEKTANDTKQPAAAKSQNRRIVVSPVIKDDAPEDIAEVHLPSAEEQGVKLRISTENSPRRADKWNSEIEREITVEELDGENARQHYLAANHGAPLPKEAPLSEPARDFIPFEKR